MKNAKYLFLLSSGRAHGNSEQLARAAAASLPAGAQVTWLRLPGHVLPPFEDLNHSGGHATLSAASLTLRNATLDTDHLVLVTPVYWFMVSAALKRYLDEWATWLSDSEEFQPGMRGKTFWLISTGADDAAQLNPIVDALKQCASYFKAHWGGELYGMANKPGEVQQDTAALEAAKTFFQEGRPTAAPPELSRTSCEREARGA